MKTLLLFSFLLIVGCVDNGQRTRMPVENTPTGESYNVPTPNNGSGLPGTIPGGSTSSPSGSTTTQNGFENCDITQKYYASTFGHFGLCQSSSDETVVKIKPSLTMTDSRVCLLPLWRNSSGASYPIGMPQCLYPKANEEMLGKLYKDSAYQNNALNSILVIRESLLPNYYSCVNAYTNFIKSNCAAMQTLSCQQAAQQYQSQTCNNFVTTYQNQSFVSVRVKD